MQEMQRRCADWQEILQLLGYGFEELIKKGAARKKTALFASALVIALIIISLSLLVAQEHHKSNTYIESLKLENFKFPEKTKDNNFKIHYELSHKQMPGTKGIRTYINGISIYTNDSEAKFDGKNIDWIVHLKKKGIINFNVSLYHYDKLLDSRQHSINATA